MGEELSSRRQEHVKKAVALILIRRGAVEVLAHRIIRRRPSCVPLAALPKTPRKFRRPAVYEHHIEPKLQTFQIGDSPWLRYLAGLSYNEI